MLDAHQLKIALSELREAQSKLDSARTYIAEATRKDNPIDSNLNSNAKLLSDKMIRFQNQITLILGDPEMVK